MDRMCVQPIFGVKVPISINTIFDGDFDGHSEGDITCEQSLRLHLDYPPAPLRSADNSNGPQC